MTPNVVRGSGFYGCLAYVFGDGKAVGIVATNMVGRTPAELAAEFEMVWQLNLRSPNPVWHVSLSLHPHEVASHERWKEMVETFIEKVGKLAGLDETAIHILQNQYVAVLHGDRDHPHVHLILNRVNVEGEVCYCKWDHNRTQQACREIEKELGLIQVQGQAIQTEPNQILTHDAILNLEAQFEKTGVLDSALEHYQNQYHQRQEEWLYERQLQHAIESDQTGSTERSTSESSVDRSCQSVTRFVELFNAAGNASETGRGNQSTVAETRSPVEPREPSRLPVESDRDALSTALFSSHFRTTRSRQFDFSPRTFTESPQPIRSADSVTQSGSAIAQNTNTGVERDRRSLTEQLGDRVGVFSRAIAASVNDRRTVAQSDRSSTHSLLPEAPQYEFSPSSEWLGSIDGASVGERVARSLETDLAADSQLERSDYYSTARNSDTESRKSNIEDPTRSRTEDQSNRDWRIAQELAQFAEELQRSTRAKRNQNRAVGNTADTDAEVDQSDRQEDPQCLQSPPQIDDQRRDDDLSRTDYSVPGHHDLHRSSGLGGESDSTRHQQADLRSNQQRRDSPQTDRKQTEIVTPKSRDINQARQAYDQLWHHYNQGLKSSLDPFQRDVAIASKALPERGIEEARKILCRSPHTQALVQTGDRDHWMDYVQRVVAAAQEKLLPSEQRDLCRFAANVIDSLLKENQASELEGNYYLARFEAKQNTLTLSAKDGRGEILKRQGQYLVKANLTEQDMARFEQTNAALQQRQNQRENQSPPAQAQRQIKPKQFEMGD
jgi:Relaxase/Mobilisation nuclease domain